MKTKEKNERILYLENLKSSLIKDYKNNEFSLEDFTTCYNDIQKEIDKLK